MKKWMTLCILSICLMLCGCGQKENKENETSFVGTIIDMTDTSVHMSVEEGDEVLASGNEVTFEITDELKASKDFTPEVGDRLSVTIRGDIAESFPLQVTAVSWAPNLVGSAYISTEESGQADYLAMIMVQGKLYYDSDEVSTEVRCGNMDGEITSTADTEPTKDNQSNFGMGYGYQYGADDTIQVNIDNSWHIFIPYGVKQDDWDNLTEQQKMEQDPTYHSDEVAYSVIDGTYTMDSEDESQMYSPSVTFSTEDNAFLFTFDVLSSYANHGTYFVENDEVVATTSDEKYVFVFQIIDDAIISFVEDKSASTKTVEGKVAVPDGAVFNK